MPLAWVSQSHIVASAGDFDAFRQRMGPVEYEPVTFAAVLPSRTALQTRPCMLHPQIGASSPPRPWLSAWNQAQKAPSSARLGPPCTPPPRLAKKKLEDFFSFAIPS